MKASNAQYFPLQQVKALQLHSKFVVLVRFHKLDKMQDSGGDKNINKFDLTTKVALTKDNKGGTTATLHPQFRTMQQMRVVTIPSSSAGAQIIQTQLVPQVQTMIKQGKCSDIGLSKVI